jgi:hypothetical protein
MVVRTLNRVFFLGLILLICSSTAFACFGPKLYWGVDTSEESRVLYALASIYVQEKTGVESVLVDLEEGQDPLLEMTEERVDLVFVREPSGSLNILIDIDSRPALVSGPRPLEDLQFTTVAPAMNRLAKRLTAADVSGLVTQVEAGVPPLAAARKFLMERRWI